MIENHQCGRDYCEECRQAVTRTYRELHESGRTDRAAFRAAVTVLSLRHPGRPMSEYINAVSDWLTDDLDA